MGSDFQNWNWVLLFKNQNWNGNWSLKFYFSRTKPRTEFGGFIFWKLDLELRWWVLFSSRTGPRTEFLVLFYVWIWNPNWNWNACLWKEKWPELGLLTGRWVSQNWIGTESDFQNQNQTLKRQNRNGLRTGFLVPFPCGTGTKGGSNLLFITATWGSS
jgi:hypothetical protein